MAPALSFFFPEVGSPELNVFWSPVPPFGPLPRRKRRPHPPFPRRMSCYPCPPAFPVTQFASISRAVRVPFPSGDVQAPAQDLVRDAARARIRPARSIAASAKISNIVPLLDFGPEKPPGTACFFWSPFRGTRKLTANTLPGPARPGAGEMPEAERLVVFGIERGSRCSPEGCRVPARSFRSSTYYAVPGDITRLSMWRRSHSSALCRRCATATHAGLRLGRIVAVPTLSSMAWGSVLGSSHIVGDVSPLDRPGTPLPLPGFRCPCLVSGNPCLQLTLFPGPGPRILGWSCFRDRVLGSWADLVSGAGSSGPSMALILSPGLQVFG
jgi:hypothetical protein